ncbi:hypothetical protein EAH72_34995 [Pseudomonas caspiana]|nr:hypothetical protein EAH72_34995 [Pseudomonas caspiana]
MDTVRVASRVQLLSVGKDKVTLGSRLCSQSIDLESKIIASRVQLLTVSKNEILFNGRTCEQIVHVSTTVASSMEGLPVLRQESLLG